MSTKIHISKNVLLKLYIHKKRSATEVARLLGVSPFTIFCRLKEFKIPKRNLQQSKSLFPPKYPRYDFQGSKEEKAYLIGFRLGDLYVSKTHPDSPTIRVSTNSGKHEQLDLFKSLFQKYGHTKQIGPDKRGAYNIRCFLNKSFNFLIPTKNENLPTWIFLKNKTALSFLAGYIDAEGTFSINYRNAPVFSIKSQDKEIMEKIQKLILPMIEVYPRLLCTRLAGSVKNMIRCNKDVYGIFVYNKRDLLRILKYMLPLLRHKKRKNDALRVMNLLTYGRTQ